MRNILCILSFGMLVSCTQASTPVLTLTTVNGQSVHVTAEVADTDEERSLGLMNRTSLPENHGMLFVFDHESRVSFWMKNTLIPLDILYINQNGIVVDVQTMQPCTTEKCTTYPSAQKAMYALELNAGFAEQHGITKNAQVNAQEFVQQTNVQ